MKEVSHAVFRGWRRHVEPVSAGARREIEVLQVIEEVGVVVCVATAEGRGSGLNDKCLVLEGDESPAEVITGIW